MVGSDAGQGLGLITGSESVSPGFTGKDSIVAMVSRYIDSTLCCFCFELAFTGKGISAPKRDLMVDLDETRRGIKENGSPNVLGGGSFAAISVGESATDSRFVLIDVDAVARMELFFSEGVLVSGTWFLLLRLIGTSFRFGGLTG
jgi:hypothetical protein